MEDRLILCAGCGRHVFAGAEACPFCALPRDSALHPLSGAKAISAPSLAAAVVVSGALLAGCSAGQQQDGPPPDATAVAAYGAPAPSGDERIPEPSPSEQTPPQPTDPTGVPPPAPMYGPPPKQGDDR